VVFWRGQNWRTKVASLVMVTAGLAANAPGCRSAMNSLIHPLAGGINTGQKKASQEARLNSTGTGLDATGFADDSICFSNKRQTFSVLTGRDIRQRSGKTHYWGISTQCSGRSGQEAAGSSARILVISSLSVRSERLVRLANSRPYISVVGMYGRASLAPEPLANRN